MYNFSPDPVGCIIAAFYSLYYNHKTWTYCKTAELHGHLRLIQ